MKPLKILPICMAIVGIITLATAALGQEVTVPLVGTCTNESYIEYHQNINISGVPSDVVIAPTYCPFGCLTNVGQYGDDCMDNPARGGGFDFQLIPIIGFSICSFILMFFAMNVGKEHGPLQILFAALSYFFIWATVGAIQITLDINKITSYNALVNGILTAIIWGGVLFIGYLVISFLRNLFGIFADHAKGVEDGANGGH